MRLFNCVKAWLKMVYQKWLGLVRHHQYIRSNVTAAAGTLAPCNSSSWDPPGAWPPVTAAAGPLALCNSSSRDPGPL